MINKVLFFVLLYRSKESFLINKNVSFNINIFPDWPMWVLYIKGTRLFNLSYTKEMHLKYSEK